MAGVSADGNTPRSAVLNAIAMIAELQEQTVTETTNSIREDGFYWIKRGTHAPEIAEWAIDAWLIAGSELEFPDPIGIAVLSERIAYQERTP